jgi:hypothetical protein
MIRARELPSSGAEMNNRVDAHGTDLLIKNVKSLTARAGQVIEKLGLFERWGRVGKVCFVGSARFGLMATPNIDLEVYVDHPTIRDGSAVIEQIAEIEGVRQIQFCNFSDNAADPGLYWRIDYEDDQSTLWDIDNWLVPFDHPHAGLADALACAMQRGLTDETRRAILSIKAAASGHAAKYRGIDIYKADIAGGVRTFDQFLDHIREHPPVAGIETWRP